MVVTDDEKNIFLRTVECLFVDWFNANVVILFSQYSVITLLANVIAIPLAGFLILPATILLTTITALGFSAHTAWHVLAMVTQFFFE
ncbi:MAG: ComEC/Rec2 family competence protein [Gammaproteobacteria bacterium]|nr:ComEC/Rec2 family competence protein [Gammaproteobacteria bacterium]